ELEAGYAVDRQTVIATFLDQHIENGEALRAEPVRPGRLKPGEYLALGDGDLGEWRGQLGDPGAGAQDKLVGLVDAACGADADAVGGGLPGKHRLACVDFRPGRQREVDVSDDAAFGRQEATLGLKDSHRGCRQSVTGKPTSEFGTIEDFVSQAVDFARLARA